MTEVQIILKRLEEMKKLSVQLRDTTQNSPTMDYNMIRKILVAAKMMTNQKNEPFNTRSSHSLQYPTQSIEKGRSGHLSEFFSLNGDKNISKELDAKSNKRQSYSQKQQVMFLSQQNRQLQDKNLMLLHQLNEIKQKYKAIKQNAQQKIDQNQRMPFFAFEQTIQAFITKMNIQNDDLNYIQYKKYKTKLELDKIILVDERNSNKKIMDLTEIVFVSYEPNIMIIEFKGQQQSTKQKVFIKCSSEEALHKWDLSIFINHKIVTSVQKQKLFQQVFIKKNQTIEDSALTKKNNNKQIGEQNEIMSQYLQDKTLIKSYIESKEKLLKIRKLFNTQIMQKLQEKKQINLSQNSDSSSSPPRLKNFNKVEEKQQVIQSSQGQNELFHVKPLNKPTEQQLKQQLQKQRLQQEQLLKEQIIKQQQRKLAEAKYNLKSGYQFTKYAEGGWEPHLKVVYISNDYQNIYFQDSKNKKDTKQYPIRDITSVQYMSYGKGVEKHVKNPKPNEFVKITIKDKIIELGMPNSNSVFQFSEQLNRIRQYLRLNKNNSMIIN